MNMKFNKIMMAGLALCAGLAFTSCQNEPLDPNPMAGSDVKIASFGPSMLQRMDTMQIFGVKLDKASKVIFQAAEVERAAFTYASAEEIDVVIPDDARPGKIGLLVGSDTVWSKTPMVFSEPITIDAVTPAEKIVPGSQITIKGDYVYNIASVTFEVGQLVNAVDFVKCERHELVINVPMGAVAGTAVFTDGADWVEKIDLDIVGATYESISATSTDFGQELTINGTYLQLVEKVIFGGNVPAEFTVAADGKSIKVNVPADATPGAITLAQYSLVNLTTDEIELPVIAVEDVNPKTDLQAGMTVTVTGTLLDRVKSITTGGNKVVTDFNVNAAGTEITFLAPEGMTDGKIVLTQNANLSAETALVKMRKMGNLFYTVADGEPAKTSTDWGNWFQVAYNNEVQQLWRETLTEPGKLTVNVSIYAADYHCVQMQHISAASGWHNPIQVDLADGQTSATFVLTQEDIDLIQNTDGASGLVFGGNGIGVESFEWESSSAPVALWEGDAEVNWNNAVTIPLADITANLGKTLYITYNVVEADYHMIRIINQDWSFNPDGVEGYNWNFGEDGVIEKVIDQALVDALAGLDFNLTGFGCHVTKVAVK